METLFVVLSLNARRGSRKNIWPGFFTVSLFLADLHHDKILLFFSWKEVYPEFGAKIMEMKVAQITLQHFALRVIVNFDLGEG